MSFILRGFLDPDLFVTTWGYVFGQDMANLLRNTRVGKPIHKVFYNLQINTFKQVYALFIVD